MGKPANLIFALIAIVVIGAVGFIIINNNSTGDFANDLEDDTNQDNSDGLSDDFDLTDPNITGIEETEIAEYTLTMSEFMFIPEIIQAEPGQTVRVTLIGMDTAHSFNIDALNVSTPLVASGDEFVAEFIVPESVESGDEYEFYCDVAGHAQQGMVGTLQIVTGLR